MLPDKCLAERKTILGEVPVAAELLIEIRGENFVYAGQAIGASSRRAQIKTSAPLCLGTEVTVYVAETGRSATGRIISETQGFSISALNLPFSMLAGQRRRRGERSKTTPLRILSLSGIGTVSDACQISSLCAEAEQLVPAMTTSSVRPGVGCGLQVRRAFILRKPFTKHQPAAAVRKAIEGSTFAQMNSRSSPMESPLWL